MAFGKLAKEYCQADLPLTVMWSAAGYYIGTYDEEGPVSRESMEYFAKRSEADIALASGLWTQRETP